MNSSPTFFVTGATGNQGGAVVHHLLDKGYHVKALVRDPENAKAKALRDNGAMIIKGDLNDPASYKEQLKGVSGIFAVFTFMNGVDTEIKQGISLADVSKEYGVPHYIYSSVIGSDANTGIPHWESKGIIENHIKRLQLPYTILRPASFYQNFLIPQVSSRILKGKLVTPTKKEVIQQFISTEDVGRITTTIFENRERYINQTLVLATEEMTMEKVAQTFTEAMGRKIGYSTLPPLLTRLFMGKDLYKMFRWVNEHNAVFLKDIEGFKKEFPGLQDLKTWVKQCFNPQS